MRFHADLSGREGFDLVKRIEEINSEASAQKRRR
jgi:hypothetical protein